MTTPSAPSYDTGKRGFIAGFFLNRLSRGRYLLMLIVIFIVYTVAMALPRISAFDAYSRQLAGDANGGLSLATALDIAVALLFLAILLDFIMLCRRLRDIGLPGVLAWLHVALVGVYLWGPGEWDFWLQLAVCAVPLFFLLIPGVKGPNKYGADPLGGHVPPPVESAGVPWYMQKAEQPPAAQAQNTDNYRPALNAAPLSAASRTNTDHYRPVLNNPAAASAAQNPSNEPAPAQAPRQNDDAYKPAPYLAPHKTGEPKAPGFLKGLFGGRLPRLAFFGRTIICLFIYKPLEFLFNEMEPSLNAGETDAFIMLYILLAIICVALFYNISILWRRLHDLNLPGWPCLIFVVIGALAEMPEISGQMSEAIYIFKIPLFIIGIVLLFVRGTVGPNKYGPDPLGGTAPASPEPLSADAAQNLHWSVRSTTDLGKATANNNDQPR